MVPPDIYSLTIPIQYRLKHDEFKALVEAPTVEEFIKLVEETYYAKHYHFGDERTLEQMYRDAQRPCIWRTAAEILIPWQRSILTYLKGRGNL